MDSWKDENTGEISKWNQRTGEEQIKVQGSAKSKITTFVIYFGAFGNVNNSLERLWRNSC